MQLQDGKKCFLKVTYSPETEIRSMQLFIYLTGVLILQIKHIKIAIVILLAIKYYN